MLHVQFCPPRRACLVVLTALLCLSTSVDAGGCLVTSFKRKNVETLSLLQAGHVSSVTRIGKENKKEHNTSKLELVSGSTSSRSSSSNTTVVLKTYGEWTPWMDFLVKRYSPQLAAIGVDLQILHDVSSSKPDQGTVNLTTYEARDGSAKVPFCAVTWKALSQQLAQKPGQSWKTDAHIVTTVFETLWWQQCFPQGEGTQQDDRFVWFVEQDAFFNGNLAHFVATYLNEDADYMARGFRIAGPTWWGYGESKDALDQGALQTFGVEDDLVKNVWPLPEITEGKCLDLSVSINNNKHGLLFAQDHVTRYSAKFLNMLQDAMVHSIVAPGEGFKAGLCASNYGLSKGNTCSMQDFAPLRQYSRQGGGEQMNWVSPIYCWVQVGPEPERADSSDGGDLPCSPKWQDKWVHPVKMFQPALRLTEC